MGQAPIFRLDFGDHAPCTGDPYQHREAIERQRQLASQFPAGDLAAHLADILLATVDVLDRSDGTNVDLDGCVHGMSHFCMQHVEAAIYFLASIAINQRMTTRDILCDLDGFMTQLLNASG